MNTLPNSNFYLSLFGSKSKQDSDNSKKRLIKKRIVAIDTETTGLDVYDPNVRLTHISHWDNEGKGTAFEVEHHERRKVAAAIIADPNITKLIFNAKFDIRMLHRVNINFKGPVIDVMLMAQMLLPEEKTKGLKHLVRKFLKDPYLEEMRLHKWLRENKIKEYGLAPKHIIMPYALADAKRLMELFAYFSGGMDKYDLWTVLEREMLLMKKVVMPMESYGITTDQEAVSELTIACRNRLKELKQELRAITNNPKFNPNSPAQVVAAVYDGTVKPTRFSKKTGKPSADNVALLEVPSKLGSLIIQFRKVDKASSTYLRHLHKPLLRVSFNQGGAKTGRFSSSGPNLQNIPRPKEDSLIGSLRKCFVAREGHRLLFVDYKQIELRLTAHYSGEAHMLEAISKGIDLHGLTCRLLFGKTENSPDWDLFRFLSKTLNFAVVYGTGPDKFRSTVLKDTDGKVRITLQQAAKYIGEWKQKHPAVMRLFDDVAMEVAKTGGIVNHYGRYIPVDQYKSYVGVNYKIQGTAADFMKMKMLFVQDLLKDKQTRLVLTVHDELVFDTVVSEKDLAYTIVDTMEDGRTFKVPLLCSAKLGKNWFNPKKLAIPLPF